MIIDTLLELGEDDPVHDEHGQPTGKIARLCRIGFVSDTSAEEALEMTRTLMARLIEGRQAWVRAEPQVVSDRGFMRGFMRQRTLHTAMARFGYVVPGEPGTIMKVERAPAFVGFSGMPARGAEGGP